MMRVLEKVCSRRARPPNEIAPLAEATRCTDFSSLVRQFVAFRPHSNAFDVKAFRFWGKTTDAMTVLEFTYVDDRFVRVALPSSELPRLERELFASIERNAARQAVTGKPTRWQLESIRQPKTTGPEELIEAFRIVRISFFEALGGDTIMIRFGHPGDRDSTLVHLPNEGAQLLLQHTRNRLAFRG